MKKSLYFVALFAVAAMCVSCEKEISNNGSDLSSANEIAFILGGKNTKASVDSPLRAVETTVMPVDVLDENREIVLEESLTYLDDFVEPLTKGTPIYTENVANQGIFNAVVYDGAGTSHLSSFDAEYEYDEDKNVWRHVYSFDPWEGHTDGLWFFMQMGDMTGIPSTGTGSPQYSVVSDEDDNKFGQIKFSYTSPDKAAQQNDILFAARSITKEQENDGAKVLFYHALTAVKFRIGNVSNNTMITGVEFSGLTKTGDCTMVPYYGEWSGSPTSNPYGVSGVKAASKSSKCVSWDTTGKDKGTFSQTFDNIVDYTSSNAPFGSSFYEAAADKNLNENDASLTFWFIPQTLNKDVKLKINYTVGGVAFEKTIDFGDLAKGSSTSYPTWAAGELRTYTLTSNEVNVNIVDEVNDTTKSNVVITNTGNTNVYLRVALVGNWFDVNGKVINAIWNPTFGTWAASTPKGESATFVTYMLGGSTLPDSTDPGTGWRLGSDRYYYYIYQVPAGSQPLGKLFDTYTAPAITEVLGADTPLTVAQENAHFEMAISVQAIPASALLGKDGNWNSETYGWKTNLLDKKEDALTNFTK